MIKKVKSYKAGFVTSDSNIRPDQTLADIITLKEKSGHATVAVTEDGTAAGKLLGIVTSKDYRVSRLSSDTPVSDFMTPFVHASVDGADGAVGVDGDAGCGHGLSFETGRGRGFHAGSGAGSLRGSAGPHHDRPTSSSLSTLLSSQSVPDHRLCQCLKRFTAELQNDTDERVRPHARAVGRLHCRLWPPRSSTSSRSLVFRRRPFRATS